MSEPMQAALDRWQLLIRRRLAFEMAAVTFLTFAAASAITGQPLSVTIGLLAVDGVAALGRVLVQRQVSAQVIVFEASVAEYRESGHA
jgi:hypothetical protein